MNRPVVPIRTMQHRLPEAGRLRTGIQAPTRSGRTAPKSIETWRMTSHDQQAIEQAAAIYGGTPRPWTGSPTPGQWEVITEAVELNVVLPPDPLGGTPIYEQWTGGGCARRCDGVTCEVPTTGADGTEMSKVPCICTAKGEMSCSPHTRLSVILPDIRFGGTWRYESATSWNVMQELPGMVELIQSLQARGLTRAVLAIEHRKSAQTKKPFTVPVLRVPQSLDAIAAGDAQVRSITSPDAPAVVAGERPALAAAPDPDDEVCDAVIVDDAVPLDAADLTALLATADVSPAKVLVQARKLAESLGEDPPLGLDAIEPGPTLDALCAWLRERAA